MFKYRNKETGFIEESIIPFYELNEGYEEYKENDSDAKNRKESEVLVVRKALGDLLLLFPALELWKKTTKISNLTLVSDKWLKPLIDRQSFIDNFVDASSRTEATYNLKINLEGVVDFLPIEKRKNRTLIFADELFKSWNSHNESNYSYEQSSLKIEDYFQLTHEDKVKGAKLLRDNGWARNRPLVLLAPYTKSRLRNWQKELELIHSMPEVDFVLTHNREIETPSDDKNIINLSGKTDIIDLASVAYFCRASVVPDSGAMHLCGVLNIPTIAIFGKVIPYQNRISLYKSIIPIESTCPFIEHCYDGQYYDCKTTLDYKVCMKSIAVEQVIEKLTQFLS